MKLLFTAVIVLVAAAAANVSAEPVSVFKRSVLHREHDDDDDDDAHKIDQGELTIIANTDGAALQALAAAQGGSCGFNAEAFGPFRSTDDILPQGIVQDISFVGDVTDEIDPNDLTQENSGLTAVCATAANTAATVFGVFSPPFNRNELNTQRALFADTSFYSVSLKCPVTNVFFVLTSVVAPTLSDITVDVSRGDGPVTQATATVVNTDPATGAPFVDTSRTVTYLSVSAVSGSFDNIAIRGSSDDGFCISQVKVGCDEFEACFCEKGGDDDDDDNDDDDDDDNLPNIKDDDDDDDDGDDDDDSRK